MEHLWPALGPKLDAHLTDGHGGLRFRLEMVEAGTLPRWELKARRMVDKRLD